MTPLCRVSQVKRRLRRVWVVFMGRQKDSPNKGFYCRSTSVPKKHQFGELKLHFSPPTKLCWEPLLLDFESKFGQLSVKSFLWTIFKQKKKLFTLVHHYFFDPFSINLEAYRENIAVQLDILSMAFPFWLKWSELILNWFFLFIVQLHLALLNKI